MTHIFEYSANRLSNNSTSEMADMHFLGDVGWWEVYNYFLLGYFRESEVKDKIINTFFNKWVFYFYLKETFLVGFHWTNILILEEILFNSFGKLSHSLTSESCALLFVSMNVELLHGWGWDILALSLGSILQQNVRFDSKWLMNDCWKNTFDSTDNTLGFCFLHLSSIKK